MNNFENIVNNLLPIITKGFISIGLVLCLSGVTIAVYKYLLKKQSLKEIKTFLLYMLMGGASVSILGLLVDFIAHFDIHSSGHKHSTPVGYVIFAVIFLYIIIRNNVTK